MPQLYNSLVLALGLLWLGQAHGATEIEVRAAITAETEAAFVKEDFALIEETARVYRTEKSRMPSGLWKLTVLYGAIGDVIYAQSVGKDRDAAYLAIEEKTSRWTRQYPASATARIAHSMGLSLHAWAIRGPGVADTVAPQDWAPFYKYLRLARVNLEKHKSFAAADPHWYETMLDIARSEQWGRARFAGLLKEALDREPLYYQNYFLALEYFMPKWYGSADQMDAFITAMAELTAQHEGRGMYARMYWYAAQAQFRNELFLQTRASWPKMKDGFEDIVARYPDQWNLNSYANFACLARDRKTTRGLLKRIGTQVLPIAWYPHLLEYCTDWANKPGDMSDSDYKN
jgi:hypothetical protein